jgi:hypothetical protein
VQHDGAAAWHNLAFARWRQGDIAAARAASDRALARALSDEPRWLDAVRALQSRLEVR